MTENSIPKRAYIPRSPRVTIDVTAEIIDSSVEKDSAHCMISEAVRLALPGVRAVSTDLQTIRFTDPVKGLRFAYLTPRKAQVALVNFDQGRKPEPFTIRLTKGSVHRSGARKGGTRLKQVPTKATVVKRQQGNGDTPEIAGGPLPPRGALSDFTVGRRRSFGLRAMER